MRSTPGATPDGAQGAISWRVWRDAANPGRVLEQCVVGSWEEHLRQHERVSIRDQQRDRKSHHGE